MRSAQASIVELDKGKRYRVFVEAGRDPQTGKRRRLTKTVRGSRKDAEKIKHELLVKAGELPETDKTLAEYVEDDFLPDKQADLKELSYESYCARLRKHVIPVLGDIPMADITAQKVRRFLAAIDSPTVRREARRMLHMVFQHALYNDAVRDNPVTRVKPPKVEKYRPTVLTAQEVGIYLKHFHGSRIESAVLVIVGCGLRRGEAIALNVDDVDLETGAVSVDDSIVPTAKGDLQGPTKTENGVRVVHMPPALLERLKQVMPASGPLIQNMNGTRMKPEVLTHLFCKERDTLPQDVTRVSLKNLRHTSLTLAFDSGADLLDVSRRAGHASTKITSDFYVRPKGDRDIKAAEMMDEALSNALKTVEN